MKRILSHAVRSGALALAASQALATTLTFEDLPVGAVLGNQYAAQGVTFSANTFSGPGSATSNQDWATNSDMTIVSTAAGGDVSSLGSPALVSGNVLHSYSGWLIEDGDPSFRISFAGVATGFSAAFASVSTPEDVTLYAYNGAALVGTVSGTVKTGQFVLSYDGPVTSIAIRPGSYDDWVAVDNISYTLAPVPEAGTVAMMGLGLAMLALKRRGRTA